MPQVTVVVPTLAADEALSACLESLAGQRFRDFEVVVVDNSGRGAVRESAGVPVLAPEGTIARPFPPLISSTSASTVGLPRESRTSRANTFSMIVMALLSS